MLKLVKLPLAFLFIAALLGLLLRWHLMMPIPGLKYPYWLHAHSHTMFLGWVFNTISMGLIISFLPKSSYPRYTFLLVLTNLLVIGLLISFLLQGYGAISIILSTAHTLVVVIFCIRFFHDTKNQRSLTAYWSARMALLFFLISIPGPLAVGALSAKGMGHSNWFYFAVYYYLHFQYNGVFIFGCLGLFFRLLEEKGITFKENKLKQSQILLFAACFPAYFLSTLWASPGLIFNIMGGAAALLQLLGSYYLLTTITSVKKTDWLKFSRSSKLLLLFSFLAFGLKLILQQLSAFPAIAKRSFDVRFFLIAYLHLVLIGVISFFLLAWYNEKFNFMTLKWYTLGFLLLGFIGTETVMICFSFLPMIHVTAWLFGTSLLMVFGLAALILKIITLKKQEK